MVAPFATADQSSVPSPDLGSPLANGRAKPDGGVDVKWSPSAGAAIDATLNPDFSQVVTCSPTLAQL